MTLEEILYDEHQLIEKKHRDRAWHEKNVKLRNELSSANNKARSKVLKK